MTDPGRKRRKRPRDANQLGKLIVDIATGASTDDASESRARGKESAAVELGRRGGLKGGKARAEALSAERRREIASKAARSRWKRGGGSR